MSETGLYDVFETPSGKFRRWHTTGTVECLNAGVWQSIPEVAQAEITRLRSALASRTEECARAAQPQHVVTGRMHGAWDRGYWEGRKDAAAAIRALPTEVKSPPSEKEGGE